MKKHFPVRLSHLLRHCAVGAIVRGPDGLVAVTDIRQWRDARPIAFVSQVRAALGLHQELRTPPVAVEKDDGSVAGAWIPVQRFPAWLRCPACGQLEYAPWKRREQDPPVCQACGTRRRLEQLPWVLVHQDGHICEVPWHMLAHGAAAGPEQRQCRPTVEEPQLQLLHEGARLPEIVCTCGARSRFNRRLRLPLNRKRRQPWLREPVPVEELSQEEAEIMEISDARVHLPVTVNALVIPPESRIRKASLLNRLYASSELRRELEQARNDRARGSTFRRLATRFNCSKDDVRQAWQKIQAGYSPYGDSLDNITPGILLEKEYQALLQELPELDEDEDFVPRQMTAPWRELHKSVADNQEALRLCASVEHLVSVSRLKEIQVFKGFHRVSGQGRLTPPDIVGRSDWLPAIELYGEGVFFTLDEQQLQKWEHACQGPFAPRLQALKSRCSSSAPFFVQEVELTTRFLLLHTLAHLLIRELETLAGYPAASLKERIYCARGKAPMAGVLIYVAVPDIAGSLGGLAELATEPMRFLRLLASVFERARWCSLDPVCSEHYGQGAGGLNLAACHACALVPETSCSFQNMLLDRTLIKGDPAAGIPAFLADV